MENQEQVINLEDISGKWICPQCGQQLEDSNRVLKTTCYCGAVVILGWVNPDGFREVVLDGQTDVD